MVQGPFRGEGRGEARTCFSDRHDGEFARLALSYGRAVWRVGYDSKAFAKLDGTWLDGRMAVMHWTKCFHYLIVGLLRIK